MSVGRTETQPWSLRISEHCPHSRNWKSVSCTRPARRIKFPSERWPPGTRRKGDFLITRGRELGVKKSEQDSKQEEMYLATPTGRKLLLYYPRRKKEDFLLVRQLPSQ